MVVYRYLYLYIVVGKIFRIIGVLLTILKVDLKFKMLVLNSSMN